MNPFSSTQAEYSQALQAITRQTDSAPFIAFMLRMILDTVTTSAPQASPQVTPQVFADHGVVGLYETSIP